MKFLYLASTLSIAALLASSTLSNANAVIFTPPVDNGTPSQSTGGASRGNFFIPSSGKGTPQTSTGGASRGNFFTPATGKGTPQTSTGGASRGDLFTPAAGKGAPQTSTGGASRVGTYDLNASSVGAGSIPTLMALLPENFYGTTVSEHPTILVYLPASNAEEAVFSLKDEAGNTKYQMTIPIAGKTGIIAVKLPEDAPTLEIGKNYHWFLAVKLDGQLGPSTPYIDGLIQRIQPTNELVDAMQEKDALQRAAAFGKNGVWYDCVATLAILHSSQKTDHNITKQWEELLSLASLKEIAAANLLLSEK